MNFGKYVKILRKDNFLTQEEFANKLGVSRQTVSNWEQNITTPNLNDIEKICKVFNIELNYFCKKGKSSNNLFKKVLKLCRKWQKNILKKCVRLYNTPYIIRGLK